MTDEILFNFDSIDNIIINRSENKNGIVVSGKL